MRMKEDYMLNGQLKHIFLLIMPTGSAISAVESRASLLRCLHILFLLIGQQKIPEKIYPEHIIKDLKLRYGKAMAYSIPSSSGMVASKSTPYQGLSGFCRVTSMVCAV